MKFRNLFKFVVKTHTYLSHNMINGLKQGSLFGKTNEGWYYAVYGIFVDDVKHGTYYEVERFYTTVTCYNRGTMIKKIKYDDHSHFISSYKTYKNNQLHSKIFREVHLDNYADGHRRFEFINYNHGDYDGYQSVYISSYIQHDDNNIRLLKLDYKVYYVLGARTFQMKYKSNGKHELTLYSNHKTYIKLV